MNCIITFQNERQNWSSSGSGSASVSAYFLLEAEASEAEAEALRVEAEVLEIQTFSHHCGQNLKKLVRSEKTWIIKIKCDQLRFFLIIHFKSKG
jgi:hypothetical protein